MKWSLKNKYENNIENLKLKTPFRRRGIIRRILKWM